MRILVLSDTHLDEPDQPFLDFFQNTCLDADMLLHCGDMTGYAMLELLETHPRFHAVAGNTDNWRIAEELPNTRLVDADGFVIGMAHGHGFRSPIGPAMLTAFGPDVDMVCYGHTHVFEHIQAGSRHILNPGSFRLPRKSTPAGYALITLDEGGCGVRRCPVG